MTKIIKCDGDASFCKTCDAMTKYNGVCQVCEWKMNDKYTGQEWMKPDKDWRKIPVWGIEENDYSTLSL